MRYLYGISRNWLRRKRGMFSAGGIRCAAGRHVWRDGVYDSGPGYPVCWTHRCNRCEWWEFAGLPRFYDPGWPDHVKEAYIAERPAQPSEPITPPRAP